MRNLLMIGVLLMAAFMAGWFTINREGDQTTIQINRGEIREDTRRVIDRGRDFLDQREQEQWAAQQQEALNGQTQYYDPGYQQPPAYYPPSDPNPYQGQPAYYPPPQQQPNYQPQQSYYPPVNPNYQPQYGQPQADNYQPAPVYQAQGQYPPVQ